MPHVKKEHSLSLNFTILLSKWDDYTLPPVSKQELKEMILLILTNCTFTFNTIMGAIFSVKFANIYIRIFFLRF